ncbi:hypothetical protein J056_002034 [Wallemia ichthyophaga EXF-994]|uniref:Uncharacterized protein n=1 Tax=Wallemia ichthyophaga (strain EXF-994 / CBS 113033) TaxID=1299270 RepID=R9AV33_WALI9|nr:uncharacterized protein J056_002034 [Wallemia ichthyophaga EXF-994]EOR03956.1 hypothetical protein J056_002034 [Wallemia ichthyophaga EXF-994]TIB02028.1 hypothetical protein E3P95_01075 [Wallemia ichthyophaga]TIB02951.1 hypothetical protein E3P94_01207 [Wallemia ichthyophaga]
MSLTQMSAGVRGQVDRPREDILDIHQLAKSVQANRSKHSFDQVTFKDMSRFKNSRGHIKQFYECLILYKFLGRPSTDMELHSMDDFNKIPYVRGRDIPADKCALGFFPVRAKLPVGVTPSREIITMWAIDEYVKHLDSHFAYHCILHLATSKVEWTRVGDWFCNNCKMVSWAKRDTCVYEGDHKDEIPRHFLKKEIALCEPEVQTAFDMGMRVFALSGSFQGMEALDGKPGRNNRDKSKKGSQQRSNQRNQANKRNIQPPASIQPAMPAKPQDRSRDRSQDRSQDPQKPGIHPAFNSSNLATPKHQHKRSLERSTSAGIIGSKPMAGSNSLLYSPSLLRPSVANPTLQHTPTLARSANASESLSSYASVTHRPQITLSNTSFAPLSTPPQLHATASHSAAATPAKGKLSEFTQFTNDLPEYSPISGYKTIEAFNRDHLRAEAHRDLSHTTLFPGSSGPLGVSLSSSPSRTSSRLVSSASDLPPLSMTPSNSTQSGTSPEPSPIEPLQMDLLNNYNYANYSRLVPRSSVSHLKSLNLPNNYSYNGTNNYTAAAGAGYTMDSYSTRSELALNNFMQYMDINQGTATAREKSTL